MYCANHALVCRDLYRLWFIYSKGSPIPYARGLFMRSSFRIQWNLEMRTLASVRIIEVYAIQGCNKCIVNVSFGGQPRDSVLFIEVSVFQEVRISGFHCNLPWTTKSYLFIFSNTSIDDSGYFGSEN